MKKSKFLLLGSVASLASIPFVAAKCGETKEEKKPEAPTKIQVAKIHLAKIKHQSKVKHLAKIKHLGKNTPNVTQIKATSS
nr:variable surface lipoprotein [Mycoplasmopsis bovis]